jgi:hypothetical protein
MPEVLDNPNESQNSAEDSRPNGRFLLSFEQDAKVHDVYDYASRFAHKYEDILNPKLESSIVSSEDFEHRRVELEFGNDSKKPGTYAWRLSIAGERLGSDQYEGGPRILGEQYDIDCSEQQCVATHYTFNTQRAILRKRLVTSTDELNDLQSLIQYMTDTREFHKTASEIRGNITRAQRTYAELLAQKGRSFRDSKNLASLKSQLFQAGFSVGSRSISHKVPLLNIFPEE